MAVGLVIPKNVAQNLSTLATALAGEVNISSAVVVPSQGEPDVKRHHVKVTGTAGADITNAIAAVGDCEIMPGTAIV